MVNKDVYNNARTKFFRNTVYSIQSHLVDDLVPNGVGYWNLLASLWVYHGLDAVWLDVMWNWRRAWYITRSDYIPTTDSFLYWHQPVQSINQSIQLYCVFNPIVQCTIVHCTIVWLGSLRLTCRTCNPEVTQRRRLDSAPGHCWVTTLGKLFTHMCLCHQAV